MWRQDERTNPFTDLLCYKLNINFLHSKEVEEDCDPKHSLLGIIIDNVNINDNSRTVLNENAASSSLIVIMSHVI